MEWGALKRCIGSNSAPNIQSIIILIFLNHHKIIIDLQEIQGNHECFSFSLEEEVYCAARLQAATDWAQLSSRSGEEET